VQTGDVDDHLIPLSHQNSPAWLHFQGPVDLWVRVQLPSTATAGPSYLPKKSIQSTLERQWSACECVADP
jgi:hypothetical protein